MNVGVDSSSDLVDELLRHTGIEVLEGGIKHRLDDDKPPGSVELSVELHEVHRPEYNNDTSSTRADLVQVKV